MSQSLTATITAYDSSLFSVLPRVDVATGALTLAAVAAGATNATLTITDSLGAATQVSFSIRVGAVALNLSYDLTRSEGSTITAVVGSSVAMPLVSSISSDIGAFRLEVVNASLYESGPTLGLDGGAALPSVVRDRAGHPSRSSCWKKTAPRPRLASCMSPSLPPSWLLSLCRCLLMLLTRRSLGDRLLRATSVSASDVIIVSVAKGSTVVSFYIRCEAWYSTALPQTIALDMSTLNSNISVILGAVSAQVVHVTTVPPSTSATPATTVMVAVPTSPYSFNVSKGSAQKTDFLRNGIFYVVAASVVGVVLIVVAAAVGVHRCRKQAPPPVASNQPPSTPDKTIEDGVFEPHKYLPCDFEDVSTVPPRMSPSHHTLVPVETAGLGVGLGKPFSRLAK